MSYGEQHDMLIHRWVTGAFDTQESLVEALTQAGVPCAKAFRYLAIVLRIDEYRLQLKRLSAERLYQAKHELLSFCGQWFADSRCTLGNEAYVVVVLIREGFINPISLYEPMSHIRDAMRDAYGISLTLGIGTHAITAFDVPESLRNAHIAARYRRVFGAGQDISYESIAMRVGVSPPFPEAELERVLTAYTSGESAEFERQLILYFSASYSQSAQYGYAATIHLLMELYRVMPPGLQAECDLVGAYTALTETDHFERQIRIVRDFALISAERLNRSTTIERHKSQLDEILDYIQLNFHNPDLSINAIAEHVNASTNTVRGLFRESGLPSPKEYIQSIRMESACGLLVDTTLTAREISEKVGFTDSRYFYSVFKKHTGSTAFEYRAARRNP